LKEKKGSSWFLRRRLIVTKTHVQKSLVRPSSLSFSLSSDEEEEEDAEERGGSIRFVSDLLFFPLVLVIGRV
jgi:hypothetical protein